MEYTKVATDFFERLQMNAGIIAEGFTPSTGAVTGIMGATTGGFSFASNPTFTDFGEDVDNVPPNTYQLKRIQYYDPAMSGKFLEVDNKRVRNLVGAADYATVNSTEDTTHIVPRAKLKAGDFSDVWVIGDYSDNNDGTGKAGYVAVHIMFALNTAGFQWQTTKDGKGQFSFDYHGHYDAEDIEKVPFEVYVKAGTAA